MTAPQIESALASWSTAALVATLVAGLAVTAWALATYRSDRVMAERRDPWATRATGAIDALAARVAPVFEGTGTSLTETQLLGAWAACALLPPPILIALGAPLPVVAITLAAGALAPALWARAARRRARLRFESTLGSALPLVSSNLRGGLSFRASLVPVGESMPEPLRGELARLGADIDSGAPIEEALARMAERNHSKDVALLASAVVAQRQTGGNLADVIDSVAGAVRDRCELRMQVRSKTAEARTSAKILAALPALVLVAMCCLSESFRGFYASPVGIATIALVVLLVVTGYAAMSRMADMRVD